MWPTDLSLGNPWFLISCSGMNKTLERVACLTSAPEALLPSLEITGAPLTSSGWHEIASQVFQDHRCLVVRLLRLRSPATRLCIQTNIHVVATVLLHCSLCRRTQYDLNSFSIHSFKLIP